MKIYMISKFSDPYEPPMPMGFFTSKENFEKIKAQIIDKFKRNNVGNRYFKIDEKGTSLNLNEDFYFKEVETDNEEYNNLEFYVEKGYWGEKEV